jgi:hypothetical protein
MESECITIRSSGCDAQSFKLRLGEAWDVGMVGDVTLSDGSSCSGVLIGISSTALILDRWDSDTRRPAGDPFTPTLSSVAEVSVP